MRMLSEGPDVSLNGSPTVSPTTVALVDEYFGHKVTDLYRPLENDTATATLQWVKAENADYGHHAHQLDEDVERGAGCVLERIAHGPKCAASSAKSRESSPATPSPTMPAAYRYPPTHKQAHHAGHAEDKAHDDGHCDGKQ